MSKLFTEAVAKLTQICWKLLFYSMCFCKARTVTLHKQKKDDYISLRFWNSNTAEKKWTRKKLQLTHNICTCSDFSTHFQILRHTLIISWTLYSSLWIWQYHWSNSLRSTHVIDDHQKLRKQFSKHELHISREDQQSIFWLLINLRRK